jgi:hypothetical protein
MDLDLNLRNHYRCKSCGENTNDESYVKLVFSSWCSEACTLNDPDYEETRASEETLAQVIKERKEAIVSRHSSYDEWYKEKRGEVRGGDVKNGIKGLATCTVPLVGSYLMPTDGFWYFLSCLIWFGACIFIIIVILGAFVVGSPIRVSLIELLAVRSLYGDKLCDFTGDYVLTSEAGLSTEFEGGSEEPAQGVGERG